MLAADLSKMDQSWDEGDGAGPILISQDPDANPVRTAGVTSTHGHSFHGLSLEDCGQWMISIPSTQAQSLQNTREYRDLLRSLQALERLHQRRQAVSESPPGWPYAFSVASFFQKSAADDILHRILDFLECQSLARISSTCTRLRDLVQQNARRRTRLLRQTRQLETDLQLVRAGEQIDGLVEEHPHVRVPTLLLQRPVLLTNSGDADYNGVYYCTGSNGNGYEFSKPRSSTAPLERPLAHHSTGYKLRCILSKRFSNETLLWYASKEVLVPNDTPLQANSTEHTCYRYAIAPQYNFFARLAMLGDALDDDLCQYPSQSSILQRQGDAGWQSLSNSRQIHPPTVELLE